MLWVAVAMQWSVIYYRGGEWLMCLMIAVCMLDLFRTDCVVGLERNPIDWPQSHDWLISSVFCHFRLLPVAVLSPVLMIVMPPAILRLYFVFCPAESKLLAMVTAVVSNGFSGGGYFQISCETSQHGCHCELLQLYLAGAQVMVGIGSLEPFLWSSRCESCGV